MCQVLEVKDKYDTTRRREVRGDMQQGLGWRKEGREKLSSRVGDPTAYYYKLTDRFLSDHR